MTSTLIRKYIEIINEDQNYPEMFGQLMALFANNKLQKIDIERDISEEIKWAKKALKTNLRIVWWLRWYRLGILRERIDRITKDTKMDLSNAMKTALMKPFLDMYNRLVMEGKKQGLARPQESAAILKNINQYHRSLEHFISLPIPKLQSLNPRWATPNELTLLYQEIEKEWQENRTQFIPRNPNDGKIIIQFPDGFVWVDLQRHECEAEGDAMGHCGNTASGEEGETILSLRQLVKKGKSQFWHPFLTFILDANGFLGEMKGRANKKPAARYHPYIIKLLESDIIKGIKGGGYAPESNFDMSDLPKNVAEQLFEKNPNLASVEYLYKKHGMSKDIVSRVCRIIKSKNLGYIGFSPDLHEFRIEIYKNWQQIISIFGSSSSQYVLNTLEDFVDTDEGYDDHGARNLFDDLPYQSTKLIGQYIVNEYESDLSNWQSSTGEEEFDPEDENLIFSFIEWQDEELMHALKSAANTGYRYGMEKNMLDAIKSCLKYGTHIELNGEEFQVNVTYDNENDTFAYDTKCWMAMPTNVIVKLVSDDDALDELENEGNWNFKEFDVSEPNYGWSEYDEKGAIESFFENNPDFNPANLPKASEKVSDAHVSP
jgi:hypothetical protein